MNTNKNGLDNLGNTCYLNSCIQTLYQCSKLVDFFIQTDIPVNKKLSYQAKRLFSGMRKINKTIAPQSFWNAFKSIHTRFNNTEQHDSQEALLLILDTFHEELKDNSNLSIISELFQGIFISTIKCLECKNNSKKEETFFNLLFNFPEFENPDDYDIDNPNVTLNELIKFNLNDIHFNDSNLYKCDFCNKKTKAIQTKHFKKLPEYLFIYIKRFEFINGQFKKINDLVDIPFNINMQKYFKINKNYSWKSSIIQFGSFFGGHYINLHHDDDFIYIFDDANVIRNKKNNQKIIDIYNKSYVYCFKST